MKQFVKITEQPSQYRHLEKMSVLEILTHINEEDKKFRLLLKNNTPN